jgi:CoA:oxalate CoA-transferase
VLMEQGLMDALGIHVPPHRLGNRHPSMAPFDTYRCKDELIAICCGNDHLFAALADALDAPDLVSDERFDTNVHRTENQEDLKKAMEDVLGDRTAASWHERLQEAGIPSSLVLNVDATRKLEQIRVRGMVKDVGGYAVPGSPMKWGAYNSIGTTIPSPALDADGAALRGEFAERS